MLHLSGKRVNQACGLFPSRGRRFTPSVVSENKRLRRLFFWRVRRYQGASGSSVNVAFEVPGKSHLEPSSFN
jgi:hypothetical protein